MEAKGSTSSSVAGLEAACSRTRTLGIFVAGARGVPMTADKDFKRIVREIASRSGQSYAVVQRRLRADGAKPSTERQPMNIVRTIPDVRSLNMPASRAFYEGILGFNVAMEHAGMHLSKAIGFSKSASAIYPSEIRRAGSLLFGRRPCPMIFRVVLRPARTPYCRQLFCNSGPILYGS